MSRNLRFDPPRVPLSFLEHAVYNLDLCLTSLRYHNILAERAISFRETHREKQYLRNQNHLFSGHQRYQPLETSNIQARGELTSILELTYQKSIQTDLHNHITHIHKTSHDSCSKRMSLTSYIRFVNLLVHMNDATVQVCLRSL